MLRYFLKPAALVLGVLVAALPLALENLEVPGTLTIKPDLFTELPNLVNTSWSGSADIVSAHVFSTDTLESQPTSQLSPCMATFEWCGRVRSERRGESHRTCTPRNPWEVFIG